MRFGEPLAYGHLVRPFTLRQAALAQMQQVEVRLGQIGDRDDTARRGLGQALHIEKCQMADARFGGRHAGDGLDLLDHRLRRPTHLGENVGEAIALVVDRARLVERTVGAAGQHERGDTRRHDERDGQSLCPHAA